ncbi:MAG: hypothetical protein IRZ03_10650 [Acidobacterium ailaaui]|nr:hypothetical protein [Pseudacidobacterium ailaaui]
MAKLEGVKVLDMKYGEILRVEYNGEIYEKVDGPAQKGDLLRVNVEELSDIDKGDFFEVVNRGRYYDNDEGERDANYSWPAGYLSYFRKISVQPSLADRVTKLESRVDKLEGKTDDGYRLVTDREPRVGDYVKFDEAPRSYLTAGKYYEIEDFKFGDPIIIDDDGNEYDTFGDEFEVYEKVPAIKETVNNISVGDYVVALPSADDCYRITNTNMKLAEVRERLSERLISILVISHKDEYSVGDYLTVSEKHFRKATEDEIQAALKPKERPTEGDFVKVIDKKGYHHIDIGEYVKIVLDDKSEVPFKCEKLDGRYAGWLRKDEVEKVTDENALKFLRIGRKPGEFKVGDIVKGPKGNSFVDIFEVIEIREGSTCPIRFINRNGENDGFSAQANLTLIAPVEARVDRQ